MKILDRHVLLSFLRNYLISFMVLIGLYVTLDMVFAFDEFAEVRGKEGTEGGGSAWTVVRHIVDYYSYQVFLIFAYLSGVIPVVAAAFTIIRMTRFNEMTAIMAAGVPLLRVTMPIIIAALVLNVLLIIDQELIIPRMIPMLIRKHDQTEAVSKAFPISGMQDDDGRLLVAARYNPPADEHPATMEFLSVIARDSDLRPLTHTTADLATWDGAAGQWRLTNGQVVAGLQGDEPPSPPEPVDVYRSNITPEEIALYRSGDYTQLLSTPRINQLLNRKDSYGTIDLLRVKHTRWVQWLLNMMLLLLALACLLTRDPSQLKTSIMRCAAVTGLCMGVIFLSQQLAGHPQGGPQWANTWPALMAWMPIFLFFPVAVLLLERVDKKGS
ncbi:MAG TPA: LptF/LptG family permease [Tepidisphaeraceae bacterium]|nr:LptF/LptG family permease [Tepidisphaeraceae bacterium]